MRKYAPLIPFLGMLIVAYYMVYKGEETGISDMGIIFWTSAFIQAISLAFLII